MDRPVAYRKYVSNIGTIITNLIQLLDGVKHHRTTFTSVGPSLILKNYHWSFLYIMFSRFIFNIHY